MSLDQSIIKEEHSVGALMPYIKYYLPKAKVIPIILRATTAEMEMSLLIDGIGSLLSDEKTIIIASVDFSHYLDSNKAQKNDKITQQKIENSDYNALLRMNNDYLDSPKSLVALLTLMDRDKRKYKILNNTNSGQLFNENSTLVTSYFTIIYY